MYKCVYVLVLTDLKTLRTNNTEGFPISNNPFMEKPLNETNARTHGFLLRKGE